MQNSPRPEAAGERSPLGRSGGERRLVRGTSRSPCRGLAGLIAARTPLCQQRFWPACDRGGERRYRRAMRLALHQPDQAGNVGAILRLAACLDVAVDIIEPCGFAFSDRALKRAGMDYAEMARVARHAGWSAFAAAARGRIVLLTTGGDTRLAEARFEPDDILLFGS